MAVVEACCATAAQKPPNRPQIGFGPEGYSHYVGRNWNASVYSSVRGVYDTPFFVAHTVNWK